MYVSLLYFTKILDTLPREANWSEEHCEGTTLCLRKNVVSNFCDNFINC